MSEIFNEIDEDLRREKLKKLWDKYSVYYVAGVVLLVASVGGWRAYEHFESRKAAEIGAAFDRAVDLADDKKFGEAQAAFAKIGADAPAGYSTLARLRAAATAAAQDANAGVKLYDELAADTSLAPGDRDLARVRAASLLLETTGYDALLPRLEPAATPGGTYRHTARELLALSAWRANNATAAREWLEKISGDAATPASLRSRADALQALLPPVVKS